MSILTPAPVPETLWHLPQPRPVRGLVYAREAQRLLLWDDQGIVRLFDGQGQLQGQFHSPIPLVAAACSEDGRVLLLADQHKRLICLGPDLAQRWQQSLPDAVLAVAVSSLGDCLAVAGPAGQVAIFDGRGEPIRQILMPRAIRQLAFIPTLPRLLVAADFGLVGCVSLPTGEWVWRDKPVVYFGSIAVAAQGEPMLLPGFSAGLLAYDRWGKPYRRARLAEPVAWVAVNHDGTRLAVVNTEDVLQVRSRDGKVLLQRKLYPPIRGLVLDLLGREVYLVQHDTQFRAFQITPHP